MKKLLEILVLSLILSGNVYAALNCNLKADKLELNGYGGVDLSLYNANDTSVTINAIEYYNKSGSFIREYSEFKSVKAKSNINFTHKTSENFLSQVGSINVKCYIAQKKKYTPIKPLKKESWFKWWYILVGIGVLWIIGAIVTEAEKSQKKEAASKSSSKKSSNVKVSSSGNLIEDVWEGRKSLGESFWLYYFIVNGIISFGAGFLAEMNDNNIFLLSALLSNIWAGVGTWNSSTNYQLQKIKAKQPYGWAYGAKIVIVLNFLTMAGQAILLFNM